MALLRETVEAYPSQSEAARQLGLSQSYLNQLLHGKRGRRPSGFPNKVLKILGLRKVVLYEPIKRQ
jgi:transcriptional regulator with XRE-family HTH domain